MRKKRAQGFLQSLIKKVCRSTVQMYLIVTLFHIK